MATMTTLQVASVAGNVRELENVVERAVILQSRQVARVQRGGRTGARGIVSADTRPSPGARVSRTRMEDLQREHIRSALEGLSWRIDGPGERERVSDGGTRTATTIRTTGWLVIPSCT